MLDKVQKTVIRHSVPNNPSLPVLNTVLIGKPVVGGKAFNYVGTNNLDYAVDVARTESLQYKDWSNKVLVPKKTALDMLGKAWSNGGETVEFDTGCGKVSVPSTSLDDRPGMTFIKANSALVDLDWHEFQDACAYVVKAVSTDLTRPSLCSVCLEIGSGDNTGTLTATDGHRLNTQTLRFASTPAWLQDVLIPGDVAKLIVKLNFGHAIVSSKLYIDDITFRLELSAGEVQVNITSRQMEGPYPNWIQVVPSTSGVPSVNMDAADLRDTMKRCNDTASKVTGLVMFEAKDCSVEYTAQSDKGLTSGLIPATYTGYQSPDPFGLNCSYVLDSIPKDAETVELFIETPEKAIVVKTENARRLGLVMPLRLAD